MLVGRGRELGRLAGAIGSGTPVVLVGESGVGKTTLLRTAAAGSGLDVLEGGGLSTLSWVPYLLVSRALGTEAPHGDPEFVAEHLVGAVGDGLLLADDLQWTDPGSLEVVCSVAHRCGVLGAVRRGDPRTASSLEDLTAAGFELLEIEPLTPEEGAELLARLRPGISGEEARDLYVQTGGNPLLMEEIAATGEASPSLRLALAHRLRHVPLEARTGLALLALAARPLALSAVGGAVEVLQDAGLLRVEGDRAEIRHALLGEAVLEMTDEAEIERLHSLLARQVSDTGEAARHHAAAGETEAARTKALAAAAAATLPGERGKHLALAATCTEGSEGTSLRLDAVKALSEAGEHEEVLTLLEDIEVTAAEDAAWIDALRSRALWHRGDTEGARRELAAGLRRAPGGEAALVLRLDDLWLRLVQFGVSEELRDDAAAAVSEARRLDRYVPRARYLLGTADYLLQGEVWAEELEVARAEAVSQGDHDVEFRAANNLVTGHESHGTPARGLALAIEMQRRARDLRVWKWEQQFVALELGLRFHAGEYEAMLALSEELLKRVQDERTREQAVSIRCLGFIDLGRFEEARPIIEKFSVEAANDVMGAGAAHLLAAEYEFWRGRPERACAAAARCIEISGNHTGLGMFAAIIAGWARLDLGEEPDRIGPDVARGGVLRMVVGGMAEREGIGLLADGDGAGAADTFRRAAELHAPYSFRSRVRCLWATGEALVRSGDLEAARSALEEAEELARSEGMTPLLARIDKSLRAAGVRRAARRSRTERGLTGREQEILRLVGEGLTNAEIARTLGIAPRTVASLASSATTKLGARSRAHAASMLRAP